MAIVAATSPMASNAPFILRQLPRFSNLSPFAISLPNSTTGCGNFSGSPNIKSSTQPTINGKRYNVRKFISIVLSYSLLIFNSSTCQLDYQLVNSNYQLVNSSTCQLVNSKHIALTNASFSSLLCAATRKCCGVRPLKFDASRINIPYSVASLCFSSAAVP